MQRPHDFRTVPSLLAFPVTALTAGSALGLSLASNAFGIWMGAVSVATGASRELLKASSPRVGANSAPVLIKALDDGDAYSKDERTAVDLPAGDETAVPVALDAPGSDETAVPFAMPRESLLPDGFSALAGGVSDLAVLRGMDEAAVLEEIQAPPLPVWTQPPAIDRPEMPDDLRAISGIGPKVQKRLNDLGVWTYAQIAAWSEAETGWIDKKFSLKGRVGRDDWIGQAAKLAVAAKN